MYYETHITIENVSDALSLRVFANGWGWHCSCIHGDPVYGDRALYYVNGRYGGDWTLEDVTEAVDRMAGMLLEKGFSVIRRKVEMVVYDKRTETQ